MMKSYSKLYTYLLLPAILLHVLILADSCRNKNNSPIAEETTNGNDHKDTTNQDTNHKDTSIIPIKVIVNVEKNADNTYTILGLKDEYKDTTTITIPMQIDGIEVSTIGMGAFQNTKIRHLTFEKGSKLKTIKAAAFFNSDLAGTITFPASIETLEEAVVSSCKYLEKIMFEENSQLKVLPKSVFASVRCQEIILPKSIEKIQQEAFYDAQARKVIFENNSALKEIQSLAFNKTNVDTILLPQQLESLEKRAFWESTIRAIIFEANSKLHTIGEEAFGYSEFEYIVLPNSLKTIGIQAFRNCSYLKNIVLGNQMDSISSYMFNNCTSLESISIPNSIKTIDRGAFANCSTLTSLQIDTIYSQLHTIEGFAFQNCRKLKDVNLPDNLASIGKSSFFNCKALNSIKFGTNESLVIKMPFVNIDKLDIYCRSMKPPVVEKALSSPFIDKINIYVPADKVEEYKKAIGWDNYEEEIQANK